MKYLHQAIGISGKILYKKNHWVSEEKITHKKLEEHCLGTVVMPGGCGNVSRYNNLLPFFHAIVDSLFPLGTGNRWVS